MKLFIISLCMPHILFAHEFVIISLHTKIIISTRFKVYSFFIFLRFFIYDKNFNNPSFTSRVLKNNGKWFLFSFRLGSFLLLFSYLVFHVSTLISPLIFQNNDLLLKVGIFVLLIKELVSNQLAYKQYFKNYWSKENMISDSGCHNSLKSSSKIQTFVSHGYMMS